MTFWRVALLLSHFAQWVILGLLFIDFHFVDKKLYNEAVANDQYDAIRLAADLGRFDMAAMFLGGVSILLGTAAVFGFVEVRWRSEQRAEEAARQVVNEKVSDLFNEAMTARDGPKKPEIPLTVAAQADVIAKANEVKD